MKGSQGNFPKFSGNSKDRRYARRVWLASHVDDFIAIVKRLIIHLRKIDCSWWKLHYAQIESNATATAERMRLRALAATMSNRGTGQDTPTNAGEAFLVKVLAA